MHLQTGDIILVKGDTPIISPLIRWFTKSEYTHIGLAISDRFIYEIDFRKDLTIRPNKHKNYDVLRYNDGLTEEQKTNLLLKAMKRAEQNKGYDWKRIISFVIKKIFQRNIVLDEINRMICSEIVDYLYDDIGIDVIKNNIQGHVTPAQFAESPVLTKVFSYTA